MIAAVDDWSAHSFSLRINMVHGTKSITVLTAVKILFFIALPPFILPETQTGNTQTNHSSYSCHGDTRYDFDLGGCKPFGKSTLLGYNDIKPVSYTHLVLDSLDPPSSI